VVFTGGSGPSGFLRVYSGRVGRRRLEGAKLEEGLGSEGWPAARLSTAAPFVHSSYSIPIGKGMDHTGTVFAGKPLGVFTWGSWTRPDWLEGALPALGSHQAAFSLRGSSDSRLDTHGVRQQYCLGVFTGICLYSLFTLSCTWLCVASGLPSRPAL
jgi:hypothetical protein